MALYVIKGPSAIGFENETSPMGHIVFYPGTVVDDTTFPVIKQFARFGKLEPFTSVKDHVLKNPGCRVGLVRTYALGDVLILHAVAKFLQRTFPQSTFDILTAHRLVEAFSGSEIGVQNWKPDLPGFNIIFMLDGCLERDHDGGDLSYMHRVDIYLKALGWSKWSP
ncbi:MAG TPA: hypothetical protein PLY86_16425 [bacterium]|nr:hypothetical protein [bacterium]